MNDYANLLELSEPVHCEWFALCRNMTLQSLEHPLRGYVPCCHRCRMEQLNHVARYL